jgi:Rrf2 family nitric oxide-sensitive transcriptional repressor
MKLDDLCKALYIRKPMLIKIIQLLKSKKFIFTKKGKNGGIIINRKYVDINIYELLQELGNPYVVNNCNDFDGECCKLKCYCKASKLFSECKNLIDKKLQNITLKDLSFEKVI